MEESGIRRITGVTLYLLLGLLVCSTRQASTQTRPRRDIPADNALVPVAKIAVQAAVGRFYFSPDHRYLYFLNSADGRIQRIDVLARRLDTASVEVTDGTDSMCMSPDGRYIYTAASPTGHSPYVGAGKERGKLHVVDVQQLRIISTFEIPFDPFEMVVSSSGTLYVSGGSSQWTKIAVVDPGARAKVGELPGSVFQMSLLRSSPDRKRLYFSTTGLSPGDVNTVILPDTKDGTAVMYDSPYHGDYPLGGTFEITPDGRFLIAGAGTVLRLAKTRQDDLKFVTSIAAHSASVTDSAGRVVLLATTSGDLQVLSYPEFELRTTYALPAPAYQLALDIKSGLLFAATAAKLEPGSHGPNGIGTIAVFDVNKVIPSELAEAREHPASDTAPVTWGTTLAPAASGGGSREFAPQSPLLPATELRAHLDKDMEIELLDGKKAQVRVLSVTERFVKVSEKVGNGHATYFLDLKKIKGFRLPSSS
jgi:hypothetical protein